MADNNETNKDGKNFAWDERPLDPGERKVFRQIRRDWEWYTTVGKLVKSVSLWAVGVIGAIVTARELIGTVIKKLVQ